ncbi:ATP-binding cassette subfamily B multidrug efflux pump [Kitasatospora sp. MAP12-15]|uniref:ABC transporter ATP-binding protein n=1 Tax=unclassified Kitasatospora TaxID=2633591 RepID=UPI002475C6FF|nr:ABC transporter ATP-binding protein [Kitasatospora sp. MAP12-44]MDH6113769.1 ATP-binding cassette subfamily B multidrug efflux pump [Kitasatospora sp. MAP12-44]
MLIRLLRTHLAPYRGAITLVLLLQLAQTLATLYLPALNADLINKGVVIGDTSFIVRSGALMTAVSAAQMLCSLIAVYLGSQIAVGVGSDVRAAVFARVQSFSAHELNHFGTPSLITRSTNDVQQVQTLVQMTLTLMVVAPLTCIGGIAMALRQDSGIAVIVLIAVPSLAAAVAVIVSRMGPQFRVMQTRIDHVNLVLREQISGVRVIRAFVRDRREQRRFAKINTELSVANLRVGRLMALMYPTVLLVMNGSSVAVLWFGGHRIASGAMQVGSLTAFLTYLVLILMSVMTATFMMMSVPRAAVCAERIIEVIDTEPSIRRPSQPATPSGAGELDLRGVEFRYAGAEQPVLSGIDLIARPGRTTAIVGPTGSGKSTLLNLIPRLVDATDGTVSIDGCDVRTLAPEAISSAVTLVAQRPFLFSGTVASNLRYGKPDATDEELWRALEIAQARDFVEQMPDGLETAISQGGTNVSGGQRQRLAIARALVHQPRIYLFDDSFSALDYATDAALRSALARETAGATTVIVAQRLSTVRDAGCIVVLDEGRVVGTGTHDELMNTNQTYREIALSQLVDSEAV